MRKFRRTVGIVQLVSCALLTIACLIWGFTLWATIVILVIMVSFPLLDMFMDEYEKLAAPEPGNHKTQAEDEV